LSPQKNIVRPIYRRKNHNILVVTKKAMRYTLEGCRYREREREREGEKGGKSFLPFFFSRISSIFVIPVRL